MSRSVCHLFIVLFCFFSANKLNSQTTKQSFVHKEHAEFNKKHPKSELLKSKGAEAHIVKGLPPLQTNYEIFGWYPNWDTDYYKVMNYNLITTVAYFSFPVDPHTGNESSSYDWATTPLVDSVKAHGKNILLTATNFGGTNNKTLLNNNSASRTLITNLVNANALREGNGICIDFEGLNASDSLVFVKFIRELKNALLKQDRKNLLYLSIPAVDWGHAFITDSLNAFVDRYVIMGYDYYYSGSDPGPISPLNSGSIWASSNLTKSVVDYLNKGVHASKLILALPFYGQVWETDSKNIGAVSKGFDGSLAYNYIKKNLSGFMIEPNSESTYSMYAASGTNNPYKQCWFEGDTSFAKKINLIKEKNLAGLGIWALGYDEGYKDLWVTIIGTFGKDNIKVDSDSTKFKPPFFHSGAGVKNAFQNFENQVKPLTQYPTVFLIVFSCLTVFGSLGLLIGLLFPDTRLFFFSNASIRNAIVAFVLIVLIIVLNLTKFLRQNDMILIFGFIAGAVTISVITRIIKVNKKNLP